ncbi:VWA domain-containing protein [Vibrio sp. FNV 38]|nr:VWA domain-containing protein [Vibrio sp. FNV 38]
MIDFALLTQFHFIRPHWLWLLIPIMVLVLLRLNIESKPRWFIILPEHLRTALTIGEEGWRSHLPLKALSILLVLAALIAAGPTWQRQASPFGEDQASLVIVLDTSQSMLETDIAPNRLTRSKQKIRDLLDIRGGGRNALIVFAGSAHIAMPLTQDRSVFLPFLEAIEPSVMPRQGKNGASSIPLIEAMIKQQQGATVLYISDQVNKQTISAFQNTFTPDQQILVFGFGNPNINSPNPADLESLAELAAKSGGKFVSVSTDDADVQTLNRYIERNMILNGDSAMPWQDLGYYLVFPLCLIMMLWFRRGWLVQWCWIFAAVPFVTLHTPSHAEAVYHVANKAEQVAEKSVWQKAGQWWIDLWLTPDQQGQWLFNQHQYLRAAEHFKDPFRKGIAYYYGNDYKRAESQFVQLVQPKAKIYTANALARQREYIKARNLLKELVQQPNLNADEEQQAQHNLIFIEAIIAEADRVSESQIGSPEGQEQSTELAEDQPQTGEGVEEQTINSFVKEEKVNADKLLNDQAMADKWLKRVESNPSRFLRTKFQIQLNQEEDK